MQLLRSTLRVGEARVEIGLLTPLAILQSGLDLGYIASSCHSIVASKEDLRASWWLLELEEVSVNVSFRVARRERTHFLGLRLGTTQSTPSILQFTQGLPATTLHLTFRVLQIKQAFVALFLVDLGGLWERLVALLMTLGEETTGGSGFKIVAARSKSVPQWRMLCWKVICASRQDLLAN